MPDEMDGIIRKCALENAAEHEGVAQAKSILGKILGEHPELRDKVLELRSKSEFIVNDINRLTPAQQKKELDSLGGYTPMKRVERKGLPELELTREKFIVRFAPNPDGAIHLGNARPAILSDEYAKKYNGKFILRFDDTDPKIKTPEKRFYGWIREDLKWMGVKVHQELIASRRLNIYYKHAERAILLGGAYVCTCNNDSWKKLRDKSQPCPCRNMDAKVHMQRWKKMLKFKYKEGQAVLRIKTDLSAKNSAIRDWAAFRIVDKPEHPLNKKAHLWPLYNFASGIDDYLCKVTHIFRAQEHSTNEVKQRYLYQIFKWTYPIVMTLGRFSLSDMVLSKSQIREGIVKRQFTGWDDPKLGTIRALRRRGFQPDALRHIIVDVGPKPSDITISYENLSAYNRKMVDKIANRYFFILNPRKIEVKGLKIKQIKIPLHPEEKRGFRSFSLSKFFYITAEDFEKHMGLEVRLKDLCNIKVGSVCEFTGTDLKPLPKIQWVPAKYVRVKIRMPHKEIKGYGEINLLKAKVGDVIQFERFGFVRIEKIARDRIFTIFSHE